MGNADRLQIIRECYRAYECTRADGSRFRNTEVMSFEGDKVSSVEVYFGWNLECRDSGHPRVRRTASRASSS